MSRRRTVVGGGHHHVRTRARVPGPRRRGSPCPPRDPQPDVVRRAGPAARPLRVRPRRGAFRAHGRPAGGRPRPRRRRRCDRGRRAICAQPRDVVPDAGRDGALHPRPERAPDGPLPAARCRASGRGGRRSGGGRRSRRVDWAGARRRRSTRRHRAVAAIDLAVPAGRVFGFLGPNGSGKATTIRLLLGLLRPTAGEARLLGEPAGPGAAVVARVGALVERPAFYPYLSAAENLLVFGVTAGLAEGPLRARVPTLLARVGLADVGERGVGGFSTGMRQRLALALALLREPELLVLDEPTNGLDPAGVVEVRQLIAALAQDGITVFLSTHVLTEVEQLCTDVAVLVRGRMVAQGPTRALLGGGADIRI